jgi:hypothetical protein
MNDETSALMLYLNEIGALVALVDRQRLNKAELPDSTPDG